MLSYYLYDAKVNIKCDQAPLHKFLTAHTLNSLVNNWETEIAGMSCVIFEHIKCTESISHLRSVIYIFLDPEGEGKEFDQGIFWRISPHTQRHLPAQEGKEFEKWPPKCIQKKLQLM